TSTPFITSGPGSGGQGTQNPGQTSVTNSVASLSSTIAASGLVLLPPPPLTSKNLTIHTSLLSTKQQLLQQQQQLQQLHHAQLNAALKKQQQQLQLQQQGLSLQDQLQADDCLNGAQSDDTVGESPSSAPRGLLGSQPTSQSTTRVTSPMPGTALVFNNSAGSASPTNTPGISSLLGGHGFDHYPPPDQWNYTMTRYHASLIPLCQIEEPPTFYEGMDDPLTPENNDDTSIEPGEVVEREARQDVDDDDFVGLDVDHSGPEQRQGHGHGHGHGLGFREGSDAKPHPHPHPHRPPPYHVRQLSLSQQRKPQQDTQPHYSRIDDLFPPAQEPQPSSLSHLPQLDEHRTLPRQSQNNSESLDHEAHKLARQQRRRERTLGSGEQIFFYDGPNLLHAKLYSDRDKAKSETFSEMAMSSTKVFSSGTGPGMSAPTSGTPSSSPRVPDPGLLSKPRESRGLSKKPRPRSQSPRSRSRSQSPSYRSRSRSRSGSRSRLSFAQQSHGSRSRSGSRPRSEAWSRTKSESFARGEAVASSAPLTRPNVLSRGFSVDSNPQNDTKTEHWFMQGKSRDGTPVTIGRKMKAKDRLVSLIKRGTNNTTASPLGIAVENGASQESLPQSSIHRNSIDERGSTRPGPSPDLSQTRSRRQGSPAVSRSGNVERPTPPVVSADAMMGFPYNNSSLLMSTDLGRAVPSKSPLATKTTRSSKPRPFSVATMEKLMSPGQDNLYKDRSSRPHRDRVPLERQDSGVEHSPDHNHRRLFRSTDAEDSNRGRARITGSGSHPLLSTFESPFSNDDATKGKQTEKTVLVSSPVQEDVDTMKGPLHVHEHHIHHHYYCQHCPPMIPGELEQPVVEMDHHYNVGQRRRPDSSPILSMFQQPQQPQKRRTLDVFGTSPQGHAQGHANTMASDEGSTAPLVTTKKKSILGTMTVKSSMRKRFFAEQKKQEVDLSHRRGSQQTEKTSPLSSLILSDFEKENGSTDDGPVGRFVSRHRVHVGPYGPAGATIRVKRNQTRIPLDGLTDDELDEEGNTTIDSQDPERSGPQPEGNQRAKFLSRLKRFLLRPSPFANKGGATAGS
ncbi:hypothetical protein BGZ81_003124, partial [Podila clonocystis]